jgi:hypothetical protein
MEDRRINPMDRGRGRHGRVELFQQHQRLADTQKLVIDDLQLDGSQAEAGQGSWNGPAWQAGTFPSTSAYGEQCQWVID